MNLHPPVSFLFTPQLVLPEGTGEKSGHNITSHHMCSDLIQPTTFGDLPKFEPRKLADHDDHKKIAGTTAMEFSK